MNKFYPIIAMLCFFNFAGYSQAPPCPLGGICGGSNISAGIFQQACATCDLSLLDGFIGSTCGIPPDQVGAVTSAGWCGTIENNTWFGFVATNTVMSVTVIPTGCQNSQGMQGVIWQTDCTGSFTMVSNCVSLGSSGAFTIVAPGLVIGETYLLMLDGFAGDCCDYSLEVSPADNIPPPDNIAPGTITMNGVPGLTGTTCFPDGDPITFCFDAPAYASEYVMSWPPTMMIDGVNGGAPTVFQTQNGGNGPQCYTVEVLAPGGGQICITPRNSCGQGSSQCVNINVQIIPPIILAPIFGCATLPFDWDVDGQTYYPPAVMQATLTSQYGCDSLVTQQLLPRIITPTILPQPYVICDGSSVTVEGITVNTGGTYDQVYTSIDGCDSMVIFNVIVDTTIANISGSGIIDCNNINGVNLSGSGSQTSGAPSYQWYFGGSLVGTGVDYTATDIGVYKLVVQSDFTGHVCSDSTTIDIGGDLSPPADVVATGGSISCQNATVTLNGSSSTPGATYHWIGPGGSPLTPATQNPTVTQTGTYTLVVTNPSSNCTATATAEVTGSNDLPTVSGTQGAAITCTQNSTTISVTTNITNGVFTWSNAGSSNGDLLVTSPGDYTVTVTNPTNNCSASLTINVANETDPPMASATVQGILTCTNLSATLTGTAPNAVTYSWSGPNGFTGTGQTVNTPEAGSHEVTITDDRGCIGTATVDVTSNYDEPTASSSAGVISCVNTSTQILMDVMPTTQTYTYQWGGPAVSDPTIEDPMANAPGTYDVTITAGSNGCTTTSQVQVMADTLSPTVTADKSTDIDCLDTESTLTASSGSVAVSYIWSNASNAPSTTVSSAGVYSVTITEDSNGCTGTASVTVNEDKVEPDLTTSTVSLDCNTPTGTIMAISNNAVSYNWVAEGVTTADLDVSAGGNYTVVVTGANDCTAEAVVDVSSDMTAPGVSADGVELTCTDPTLDLTGQSATANTNLEWYNGATPTGTAVGTGMTYSVSTGGQYTVLATSMDNGCTSSMTVDAVVNQDEPTASATVSGDLTCIITSVNLQGSTPIANPVYSWTGPAVDDPTIAEPTATMQGMYDLVVTDPSNGCTSTASVDIALDGDFPEATISGAELLTCDNTSVQLVGSSTSTGNLEITWEGPGITLPDDTEPIITEPGDYILHVLNTDNGCETPEMVTIGQDTLSPQDLSAIGGQIPCGISYVQISGSASLTSAMFDWIAPQSGKDYVGQVVNADETGIWTFLVTDPANGCTATTTAEVESDVNAPFPSASVDGILSCDVPSVNLTGSATNVDPSVATYEWQDDDGNFLSSDFDYSTSTPGEYHFIVTNTSNNCESEAVIVVQQNLVAPMPTVEKSNDLDCINTDALLSVTTDINATYSWSDGGTGNTPSAASITVDQSGNYNVVVTNPETGCTNMASVSIVVDQVDPNIQASDDNISCNEPMTTLQSSSTTPNVTYSWTTTGGNIISGEDTPNPEVDVAGTYVLVVTSQDNGCTSNETITVAGDFVAPDVSASAPDILTCDVSSVQVFGNSNTPGASFQWFDGGGNPVSTDQNPSVSSADVYTLLVTGPNGCTSEETAEVIPDENLPVASVAVSGLLTCSNPSVTLSGTADQSNVDFSWSNDSGTFTSTNPSEVTTTPGVYTLLVVNPDNGCSDTKTINVQQDIAEPTVNAGIGFQIDCTNKDGTLDGSGSTGQGNLDFTWTGTQGGVVDMGADSPTPSVSAPGVYVLVVTDEANGCTGTDEVEVTTSTDVPVLNPIFQNISCYGQSDASVTLTVNSGTPPFQYSLNNGPFTNEVNYNNLSEGAYDFTVLDANGCESPYTVNVVEPAELTVDFGPDVLVELGDEATVTAGVNDEDRIAIVEWNQILDSSCVASDPLRCFTQHIPAELLTYTQYFEVTIVDTNGCVAKDRLALRVEKPRRVYIPTAFSPNGDGNNDILQVSLGRGAVKVPIMQVFDRWGEEVFTAKNLYPGADGTVPYGWDGIFRDESLMPGVYVYYLTVEFVDGEIIDYHGDVTLVR